MLHNIENKYTMYQLFPIMSVLNTAWGRRILLMWKYFLYLILGSGLFSMAWKPKFTPWLTRPCVPTASLTYYSLIAHFVHICCPANSPTCPAPSWGLGVCPLSRIQFLPVFAWSLLTFLYVFAQMSLSVRPSLITLLNSNILPISSPLTPICFFFSP